jgi:hypothetical protein
MTCFKLGLGAFCSADILDIQYRAREEMSNDSSTMIVRDLHSRSKSILGFASPEDCTWPWHYLSLPSWTRIGSAKLEAVTVDCGVVATLVIAAM